jgi:peptidoglycan/LPS O-acetylase OafA/YrhL
MASSLTPEASNSFLQGNFSISNEWLFYLSFPLLKKFRTKYLLIVGVTCALFAIALKVNVGFYADISSELTEREKWIGIFSVWNALPFFISGILLQRYLFQRAQFKPLTLKAIGVGIIVYYVVVLTLSIECYREVLAPLILLIFIFVLNVVIKSRLLSWLGQRSYGIFFAHFLIIGGYERAIAELGISFEPMIAFIQIFFVILGSSLISELTWRYIEKPITSVVRRKNS